MEEEVEVEELVYNEAYEEHGPGDAASYGVEFVCYVSYVSHVSRGSEVHNKPAFLASVPATARTFLIEYVMIKVARRMSRKPWAIFARSMRG